MACPVCFGGDDPGMRESLNAGIGVLMGVTGIVLGCFARFFITLARRSRASAHLVGADNWGRGSFFEDTPGPIGGTHGPVLDK
jgi:hypothetical protein